MQENVSRLRGNLTFAELSRKLEDLGRPIPPLGLRRIESGERRVDADDLIALAIALDVSPITLLMPQFKGEWETDSIHLSENVRSTPQRTWEWFTATYPLQRDFSTPEPTRTTLEFRMRSQPAGIDLLQQLGFSPEGRERRNRQQNTSHPVEWIAPEDTNGDN